VDDSLQVSDFVGRTIFPGFHVPVAVVDGNVLLSASADQPRFAIVHIVEGSCVLAGPDGPVMGVAPAFMLLDEVRRPEILRANGLKLRVVYFHPNVVNSAFSLAALRSTPVFAGTSEQDAYLLRPFLDAARIGVPVSLSPQMHALMRASLIRVAAEGEIQRDDNWPCRTRSWLIELLFQLRVMFETTDTTEQLKASGEKLDQALLLVRERYNTGFTLDELAQWCGSNRTTINSYFRKLTGQSVRAYVIMLRMQIAAALLRDTLLPVSEIMLRVGYENASNFTRTFRTTTGLSPRDYRAAESWMA
jgi:AraC-like DNA-binding protein